MNNFSTKAVLVIGASAVIAWGLGLVAMPFVQGREEGFDWFTSFCRAAGFITTADGEPAKQVGGVSLVNWSPSVLERIDRGDVKKGEQIAADTCGSCHNPNGLTSDPATMPSIAGQPARAIYKQLWDIKNGTRVNDAMKGLVDELKDDEIASVALFYSRQKPRNWDVRLEPEESQAILNLVSQGDAARALPSCRSCHDSAAGGPLDAPNLIGQYPAYIAAQLHAFAAGDRRNDMFARMRVIAGKLTPDEVVALARYYQGPR